MNEHTAQKNSHFLLSYYLSWKNISILFILTIIYFLAGKIGLMLAFENASATAVWPGTGIAIAVFLIMGVEAWPSIFIGAFLVNLTTAGTIPTSLGIAIGNTLEGIVGAYLVNRFAGGVKAFSRPQGIFRFTLLAAMLSTTISATIGVISLYLGGFVQSNYALVWFTWWMGDATGDIIIAPLILIWSLKSKVDFRRINFFEVVVVFLFLFLMGFIIFDGILKNYPIEFLLLPILIWVAFRLSKRQTVTVIFLISLIAIHGTLNGFGPFIRPSQNESLIILQAFMAIITIATLIMAALVGERRKIQLDLLRAHMQLKRICQEKENKKNQ